MAVVIHDSSLNAGGHRWRRPVASSLLHHAKAVSSLVRPWPCAALSRMAREGGRRTTLVTGEQVYWMLPELGNRGERAVDIRATVRSWTFRSGSCWIPGSYSHMWV